MLWQILWKNKNTFSLTFCLSFSLIGILWQTNPFAKGAHAVGKMTDRMTGTMSSGLQIPGLIWVKLDTYRELEGKYEALQKQLAESQLKKDQFDNLKRENDKLREALGFTQLSQYPEVKAEVLGARLNSVSPRIVIGKGRADGIEPFMPVITQALDEEKNIIRAVVGVIASVDETTSIVQPLTHPGFQMGVRLPASGQWAILSGNSGKISHALLSYIASESILKGNSNTSGIIGQTVISSGEGGIFPAGIPVGRIKEEAQGDGKTQSAIVQPYAPITSMDFVIVIKKKPDPWADSFRNPDQASTEHLVTEFGPPVYHEELSRSKKEKKESARKQENKEQNIQEEETKKEEDSRTGPRRLKNVTAPSTGGN